MMSFDGLAACTASSPLPFPASLFVAFAAISTHLPQDAPTNVQMFWRWLHITAAILWIGLLYYFNLVNTPFLRELDPGLRAKIFAPLMLRAMNWFRWSSLVKIGRAHV